MTASSSPRSALGLVALGIFVAVACSSSSDAPNPNGKDPGTACTAGTDCKSLTCKDGKCTQVTGGNPSDGKQDGDETDVDCGGNAPTCADGKKCNVSTDCTSANCVSGACKAPAPDDKIKNGDETDVDCGGAKAPKCAVDKSCLKDDDCASDGCSYAKKCVESPSCVGHFGGDTCGAGETGTAGAKHESCCATVSNSDGLKIGKYLVTAGRMRAFITRFGGKLQDWANSTNPKGWNSSWTDGLPATKDDADYMLGPNQKQGCVVDQESQGGRTYWIPANGDDHSDLPQDVLDEKALNCIPQVLGRALCAYDGGRLPTMAEARAIVTNDGKHDYPWQFRDPDPHTEEHDGDPPSDMRFAHWRNYETPNPPTMRQDAKYGGPLDRAFYVAPPGRFPMAANEIGVQDAAGNLLVWVSDSNLRFAWTASWEQHEVDDATDRQHTTWPPTNHPEAINGYYGIGIRCVYE